MKYNTEELFNFFIDIIRQFTGGKVDSFQELKADASERRIYRIFSNEKSYIGIYNENVTENRAFIYLSGVFRKLNLNVPEILYVTGDSLIYLEQDLGDETLFKYSKGKDFNDLKDVYRYSLFRLIDFQLKASDNLDTSKCIYKNGFDDELIFSDMKKFYDFYLMKHNSNHTAFKESNELFRDVVKKFIELNQATEKNYFMYRDYQPRNIMLFNKDLYFIDYQSGMKGPLYYDVASFLYSGSIHLNENERAELLSMYIYELKKFNRIVKSQFTDVFYYYACLRIFQVLGSYGYQFEMKADKSMPAKMKKALKNLEEIRKHIDDKVIRFFIEGMLK